MSSSPQKGKSDEAGRMSDEESVLRLGDRVIVAVDGERRIGIIKTLGNANGPFVVVVDRKETEIDIRYPDV